MKRKIIAAMLAVAMIGSVMAAQVSAENTTSAQSDITMYQPYDPDKHIIEVGENMKVVCKRFLDSGMTNYSALVPKDLYDGGDAQSAEFLFRTFVGRNHGLEQRHYPCLLYTSETKLGY